MANPLFEELDCINNRLLTTIRIKNGRSHLFGSQTQLNFCWTGNYNFSFICADVAEIPALQSFLSSCGNRGILVDSACVLGVDNFESTRFKVYPNPTTNKVFFDNANVLFDMVTVYNALGQLVYNQKLDYANDQILNFNTFAQGLYILKFSNNTKTIYKSIIKQ